MMSSGETTKFDLNARDDLNHGEFELDMEISEVSLPKRYQLGEEIARGGNGIIFKGYDFVLDRVVAIKVLNFRSSDGKGDARRRFINEAKIAAMLQHPSIVPIYELGRNPLNQCFISMPLVHGATFEKLLGERHMPSEDLPRYLRIFEKVCQGMAYAHEKGVIHRDLKPSNIMIGSFGEVFVMDWGIAKSLGDGPDDHSISQELLEVPFDSESNTFFGIVLGTPRYMPPEQARGESGRIDKRSDVFSLGAILCTILTGQGPYRGAAFIELLSQAQKGATQEAIALLDACHLDDEILTLVKDCLKPEPENRPRDANEVSQRLTQYLESKTEEFARSWLNHTTDGIWDWNLQTDDLYLSPRLKNLLGYADHELPNRAETRLKLVHPDDMRMAFNAVQQHLECGKPFSVPIRYRHKNGSTIWILSRGVALKNEAGQFARMVGTHTDITLLMQAKEALTERGRLTQLGADIGVALTRGGDLPEILQRCVEELVHHLAVAMACIWTRTETGEDLELQASTGLYMRRDCSQICLPVELFEIDRIARERKPTLTNSVIGDPGICDQDWARREGVIAFAGLPLIFGDRVLGVMAIFGRQSLSTEIINALQTVSDSISHAIAHWRTIEGLRKSEERFTLAVRGTDEGLFDWNILSNEVYLASRFKELLGFQDQELESSYAMWESRLHPQDRGRVLQSLQQHLARQGPYQVEYRLRCKSGDYRWYQARGQALWDKEGRPVRMVGAILDVTQRIVTDKRFGVLCEITRILAANDELSDLMPRILQLVCEGSDWTIGQYWIVDQAADVLRLSHSISHPPEAARAFAEASRDRVFARNVGMPGRIWVSKHPEWIPDVTQDKNFPRAAAAARDNLHGAVAFPILIDEELHGLMEFFSTSVLKPDSELLEFLTDITRQVAQCLHANRNRRQAEEANQYLAAVIESFDEAIICEDLDGIIRTWNKGARALFGYIAEEVVGRNIQLLFPPECVHEEPELHRRLQQGEVIKHFQTVRVRKDGCRIAISVTISPIRDVQGRVVGTSTIAYQSCQ